MRIMVDMEINPEEGTTLTLNKISDFLGHVLEGGNHEMLDGDEVVGYCTVEIHDVEIR